MKDMQPLNRLLSRLWGHLSKRKKIQFFLLLCLMGLVSLAEILNIGAVIPLLSFLSAPDKSQNFRIINDAMNFLGLKDDHSVGYILGGAFLTITMIANGVRLVSLWATSRFSYSVGAELNANAFRIALYQPYIKHISQSSSDVIGGIGRVNICSTVVMVVLNLMGAAIVLVGVITTAIYLNPFLSLALLSAICILYGGIFYLIRNFITINSHKISENAPVIIKTLQEGLGSIRDVLIDGTQEIHCNAYSKADRNTRKAESNINIAASSPRYVIEVFGVTVILFAAYIFYDENDAFSSIIPTLGAIVFGIQRLLPVLQLCFSSLVTIKGCQASLNSSLDLLDGGIHSSIKSGSSNQILFERQIELHDVCYRYSSTAGWVLKNLNLVIPKGSVVGFIGKTGGGKSTLLDIVMGLLNPTKGVVSIDDHPLTDALLGGWHKKISHVPQSVYLTDATIAENIAFGIPKNEINLERVVWAAEKAQLMEFMCGLSDGLQSKVGERGIRFSGGQRQRIGIARALYKNSEVLILDEATSALDNATENSVMDSIYSLNKESKKITVLIIAHRITTLRNCDYIVELDHGAVVRICKYSEL